MSTIISTATYKNLQVIVLLKTVNQYYYKVDNPFNQNTLKTRHGFDNSTDALNAAHAYVDALSINQAHSTLQTALGSSGAADTAILALQTAGYNIVLDPHVEGCDND